MLPREIQTEHWPDRTTYDLPARPIGRLRLLGLVPMAFAVAFAWMPANMVLGFIHDFADGRGGGFQWAALAFVSIFVLVAFIPFSLGLFLLIGRTRLVVAHDRITVTEIAGPIRRSRKIRFAEVQRLEVGAASTQSRPGPQPPAWLGSLGGLTAVQRDGKKRLLLLGYPRDWLEPLAEELSGLMKLAGTEVEVKQVATLRAEGDESVDETPPKPAASLVRVESTVNGLVLEVPPAGIRRGSKGLLGFGIFWCLFMVVFTGAFFFGKGDNPPARAWPFWLFITGFWGIGLGMLAAAINMGRRRATFTTQGGSLRVDQHGLFGAKAREWRRGEIAAVRVDRSGMEVNNMPLLELQVHPVLGKKTGLLAGRNEDELRWLAGELRRALGVPTRTGAQTSDFKPPFQT